jgi:hypothetical protein
VNLRDLAAADHRLIVEDVTGGFGRELTFINPDGVEAVVNGLWNDIAQNVDLQTGALIAGRVAFVHVTMGALRAAGLSLPFGELDTKKKPWVVRYTDLGGRARQFAISEARPDRSLEVVDCYLEVYK